MKSRIQCVLTHWKSGFTACGTGFTASGGDFTASGTTVI